nr:DNA polymerase Y family protein [Corynebacterium lactis]
MGRVVSLWLPDWPVQAARLAGDACPDVRAPLALIEDSAVITCSAGARRKGVRRGQNRRHAQALCPELEVVAADSVRDAAEFEPVMSRVEAVAAGVEALRPGLIVVAAKGPVRYYGSEALALEKLLDAAAVPGVDCSVGIADDIVTAILASRRGVLVGEGEGPAFRAGVSLGEVMAESALGMPGGLARSWSELGLRTLGDVARVPKRDIANRFGSVAARWHDVAMHGEVRLVAPRELPADLSVVHTAWERPLRRVDEASFVARSLAAQLHHMLAERGYSCYRLAIVAQLSDGSDVQRIWRCAEPLDERTTADRVRWQLDGWLSSRAGGSPDPSAGGPEEDGLDEQGIVELRLEPVDVVVAGSVRQDLWHGGDAAQSRARRAAERVQGLLGPEAVAQPVLKGGRGPGERVGLVPFGEEKDGAEALVAGWPGAIPAPNPGNVGRLAHPASRVELLSAEGEPIAVTGRAAVTAEPAVLRRGKAELRVVSWAGPWPVDERWWTPDSARRAARMQVQAVSDAGAIVALLLIGHQGKWRVEGSYE